MIDLKIDAKFDWDGAPFVTRLRKDQHNLSPNESSYQLDKDGAIKVSSQSGSFVFKPKQVDHFDGDVILGSPSQGKIQRLFRANSRFNSFLLTERCDQLCLMCSQPPRNVNDSWRYRICLEAIKLTPAESTLVLTGGEPTIYKNEFLNLLESISEERPDIHLHVLSNAQHIKESDLPTLRRIHEKLDILWGIPLYATEPALHDKIVDKQGAYETLMPALYLMASAHAKIELRTVVTSLNSLELPLLAKFIHKNLSFISHWAIMAMEPTGFAKAHLKQLIFDHSIAPQPIHRALDLAKLLNIQARLFNFPLCTIGEHYRNHCAKSISDWKQKYLDPCNHCSQKVHCCGFFEWYGPNSAWENINPI